MAKSKVNLHIHTVHSDGGKTVAEVVEGLRQAGVQYFSIADHDSVEGNIEAAKLAKKYGMTHYNGIELSCCFVPYEVGLDYSWVCHVLGFCFNLYRMREKLAEIEEEKDFRLRELIDVLISDGYKIELKNIEKDGRIPARTNVAKELIAKGYAVNANECFEKILNTDKYVKFAKDKPSLCDGIKIIHECGGMAVLAHPFGVARGGKKDLAQEQVEKFLYNARCYGVDGIESYYHKYSTEQIRFLEQYANNTKQMFGGEKLCKSIGTDYHMTPVSEEWLNANPKYKKLREQESFCFDVEGIEIDESIINRLEESAKKNCRR